MAGPEFINGFLQKVEIDLRLKIEEGRKEVLIQQTVKY